MVKVLVGGVLLIAIVAAIAFFVGLRSKYTDCFAQFGSATAAEKAAAEGRVAGFDVDVDWRGERYYALTFETGESGVDAMALRESFGRIVKQNHGGFGHPGDGCLEQLPLG
jgi:hypothetical protein